MILLTIGIIVFFCGMGVAIHCSSFRAVLGFFMVLIGIGTTLLGVVAPLAGYEEAQLIETKELYPLSLVAYDEESSKEEMSSQTRILISIEGTDSISYKYCVSRDGFLNVEELDLKNSSFDIQDDVEKPIIERYDQEAKSTPFSFCVGATITKYKITIPQSMIEYRLPKPVETSN